jgi:hypothetical protein
MFQGHWDGWLDREATVAFETGNTADTDLILN